MPKVIGVKFKNTAKSYYFEAGDYKYAEDSSVIVETARGIELGKVVMLPTDIPEEEVVAPLKPVMRVATKEDLAQAEKLEAKRAETLKEAERKIRESGLNMKPVDVEYTFDASKLIIYFTADNRVDFRELVRDLAGTFKVRIELRQIGARDECKLLGGLGPCGKPCCCSAFLPEFAHVTIKMAKNQNLSLNPGKISGLCGRLMCCLSYENEHYAETNKRMPKVGSEAECGGKKGTVTAINQLKETVTLKFTDGDNTVLEEVKLCDVKFKGKNLPDEDDGDDSLKELEE